MVVHTFRSRVGSRADGWQDGWRTRDSDFLCHEHTVSVQLVHRQVDAQKAPLAIS